MIIINKKDIVKLKNQKINIIFFLKA